MASKTTGIRRVINAFNYSMQGLKAAWIHEAAFRQEVILVVILLPIAMWLGDTGVEKSLLILPLFLLLIVEMINSAIESAVDRMGEAHNEFSGRAKDMGSAAVFLSLLCLIISWAFILL